MVNLGKEIENDKKWNEKKVAPCMNVFINFDPYTTLHVSYPKQWLQNIELLVPTPPSFSARAYFWRFNFQQLVLKIFSNYFKFAATLFYLQQLYFISSDFILFEATLFYLQQGYLTCSNFLICSMSLVGHRTYQSCVTSAGELSDDVINAAVRAAISLGSAPKSTGN